MLLVRLRASEDVLRTSKDERLNVVVYVQKKGNKNVTDVRQCYPHRISNQITHIGLVNNKTLIGEKTVYEAIGQNEIR